MFLSFSSRDNPNIILAIYLSNWKREVLRIKTFINRLKFMNNTENELLEILSRAFHQHEKLWVAGDL